MGETPQGVDPDRSRTSWPRPNGRRAEAAGHARVPFSAARTWSGTSRSLPEHPNGMRFTLHLATAYGHRTVYYSVGGGFIKAAGEAQAAPDSGRNDHAVPVRHHGRAAGAGRKDGLTIPPCCARTSCARMSDEELDAGLDKIWQVMRDCIAHGLVTARPAAGRPERQAPRRQAVEARRRNPATAPTNCRTTRCTRSACTRWRSTKKTRPAAAW
jgi:L-serine dehydratase